MDFCEREHLKFFAAPRVSVKSDIRRRLGFRALRDDLTLIQLNDTTGDLGRGKSMGNEESGAIDDQLAK